MPCSQATLCVEGQLCNQLSWWRKIRLQAHLKMCKWCNSYFEKTKKIDFILKQTIKNSPPKTIQSQEIKDFNDKLKNKLKL